MGRPTGRVLTLLELLQSGGTRTVAELAERLGVEGRTVRRYVDQLIDLDVPVESVRGRYGGYRIGPGYRLPPLMLGEDEALAVLLGLVAGRRAGLATAERTAGETAAAKIRRVLPRHVARRLDTLLESLSFTDRPGDSTDRFGGFETPDAEVLLTLADAVRHRRPISIRYTGRDGRRTERVLHAYGIVAHSGRWYVTGVDAGIGEDRTFRLDRIADARTVPGTFDPPDGSGPVERVLSGFATADYRHKVTLRIYGTIQQIRTHLPAGIAHLEECDPPAAGVPAVSEDPESGDDGTTAENLPREEDRATVKDHPAGEDLAAGEDPTAVEDRVGLGDPAAPSARLGGAESVDGGERAGERAGERWRRVELRVERLDWLPSTLAALDRPFVIERPDELRDLVLALADRLASRARQS